MTRGSCHFRRYPDTKVKDTLGLDFLCPVPVLWVDVICVKDFITSWNFLVKCRYRGSWLVDS